MSKFKLLIYQELSRRIRGKLLWLGVIFLALGVYDLFVQPVLGRVWYAVWAAAAVVALLWLYYGLLMRRAALFVRPESLVLRGPLRKVKISYGRIDTATTTKIAKHFSRESLKGQDWAMVEPFYHLTCVFVEMNSFPRAFTRRRLWFSRLLFSPMRPGLLIVVEDWMNLSRAIDKARNEWHEKRRSNEKGDKRSLAAQILDY